MKDYLNAMVDLTGDSYLNPVPAIYDNGEHKRDVGTITSISIHHDATVRPHDYDSIARYHQEAAGHYDRLGPGLQYHYKIDNTGVIFKVRPHDTWLYCVGSDENTTNIAICLDGYFHTPENQKPTREQYEALGQLLLRLCEHSPEFPATYPNVRPHRDFSSTACPGDNLAPWVTAIQSKADALNVPEDAVYDWPEFQTTVQTSNIPITPNNPAPVPTAVPPAPILEPVKQDEPMPEDPIGEIEQPAPTPATPIKPGIKTTEFWLTLLMVALPLVNTKLHTNLSPDAVLAGMTAVITATGSVMAVVMYIVGRFHLKAGV